MTSPAACKWEGDPSRDEFRWADCALFFLTSKKKSVGVRGVVTGRPMPRWSSQEERFDSIASEFIGLVSPGDVVLMEGYAMGARGMVFHIGECAGVLKNKAWLAGAVLATAAPSEIKKHATGKGNADKEAVVDALLEKHGVDLRKVFGAKTAASPVSDVADAFWACSLLHERVRKNNSPTRLTTTSRGVKLSSNTR